VNIIKVAQFVLSTPGPARKVGKKLAEIVKPGDILDLEDEVILMSNSLWDEFVKEFLQIHGEEKIRTLQFKNVNESVGALIKRVIKRRLNKTER